MSPALRRPVAVAVVILACAGVVATRAAWEGRRALAAGDRASASGDTRAALESWRRAARWYLPGAPYVRGAYDRIEALARRSEAAGDRERALEAWRAVRSSARATRGLVRPFADREAAADQRIAVLQAALESPSVAPGQTEDQRAAWHLERLARDESPSVAWTLVALLGLAAWVGGGFRFAARGLTADEKLDVRQALLSGLLVAGGLLVWMLGLYRA